MIDLFFFFFKGRCKKCFEGAQNVIVTGSRGHPEVGLWALRPLSTGLAPTEGEVLVEGKGSLCPHRADLSRPGTQGLCAGSELSDVAWDGPAEAPVTSWGVVAEASAGRGRTGLDNSPGEVSRVLSLTRG